jgi:nicotine blue oxidoreductase
MVTGIVLAAGSGSRIGYPKALLEAGVPGLSFADRACQALSEAGVHHIVVVASSECASVLSRTLPSTVGVVTNPRPERGQLSSLQCALASIAAEPQAIIVLPVDVPLVRSATIRHLIDTWQASRAPVVRPARGDRHGHPVLFDCAVFDELARADSADGAKSIVRAHASPIGEVPVDDEGAFIDIDTADDYRRAFNTPPRRVLP